MVSVNGWSIASAAVQPKTRSAAGFHCVIRPSRSTAMNASLVVSRIVLSSRRRSFSRAGRLQLPRADAREDGAEADRHDVEPKHPVVGILDRQPRAMSDQHERGDRHDKLSPRCSGLDAPDLRRLKEDVGAPRS